MKAKIEKRHIGTFIFFVILILILGMFYYQPAVGLASGSGTVLSNNWWNALNWIKENTEECAVIATYWDPGHFITGIARRPVVFDGASQGETLSVEVDGEKIVRSRIQDIATTLFTTNETEALEILELYKKEGCSEMYYIASADLIGKSQWWSYFATWNPVDKGTAHNYMLLQLSRATPLTGQNTVLYSYPFGQQQAFVIRDQEDQLNAFLQNGQQLLTVEKLFYFSGENGILQTNPDADVMGTLLMQPDRQSVVFMPEQLENSLFTRMFFFNGQGLEKFEFVGNWGGEVKLFKVGIEQLFSSEG